VQSHLNKVIAEKTPVWIILKLYKESFSSLSVFSGMMIKLCRFSLIGIPSHDT